MVIQFLTSTADRICLARAVRIRQQTARKAVAYALNYAANYITFNVDVDVNVNVSIITDGKIKDGWGRIQRR